MGTDFQRRWKTQVYFSLRSKEATDRLEAAAPATDALSVNAPKYLVKGQKFCLEASAELVRLMEIVWSDQWYLDVLYTKFMQLSLELLARYGRMLENVAESSVSLTSTTSPTVSGWDASASNSAGAWTATSGPARLSCAAADLLKVLKEIRCTAPNAGADNWIDEGNLALLVLDRAPAHPEGKTQILVRTLLLETDKVLRPVLERLETEIIQHVIAVLGQQFAAIRGIPAFYRMLNKPVPTKSSPYVNSALRPIMAFQTVAAQVAPAETTTAWVQRISDGAAAEFGSQASQLLDTTRQQKTYGDWLDDLLEMLVVIHRSQTLTRSTYSSVLTSRHSPRL